MTVNVYTATIAYRGEDALNITKKGNHKLGVLFAPSSAILSPMLALRGLYGELAAAGLDRDYLDALQRNAWVIYTQAYLGEMRESYRKHKAAWQRVLGLDEVTFCCFCPDPAFCHRAVLAKIFGTMRARVCGERAKAKAQGAA